MKKTISLCIITKNNESSIEKCIISAKELISEIIIVDTGSTDNTINICKSYGAKIYQQPWDNNFSKPKNLAISKATCDFILFLDSDEHLPKESIPRIKKNLDTRNSKAYSLLIVSNSNGKSSTHGLTRLFINDKDLHFQHRVHEQIDWSFHKKYTESDFCFTDILIHHDGYDESKFDLDAKTRRNDFILDSYTDEEKDPYYYYLVGRRAFYNHNPKKAKEHLEKAFCDSSMVAGQIKYIYLLLMAARVSLHEGNLIIPSILSSLKDNPEFKDLYYILAQCYAEGGNYQLAYNNLLKFSQLQNNNVFYPTLFDIAPHYLRELLLKYRLLSTNF